jgi:ATP-dependent RNA helicase DeaD
MEAMLRERGFAAVSLSGELSQHERNHALQALRDGRARVCVATDVAARGIDLPQIELVIHAELPNDAEVLQHRSGRTGRAGRKGVSVLLVLPSRRRRAEEMLGRARVNAVWGNPPSADEIRALDRQRLLADPLLSETPSGEDYALGDTLLEQHGVREIAAALAKMLRVKLPLPEEIEDEGAYQSSGRQRSPQDRGPRPEREKRRHDGPRLERAHTEHRHANPGPHRERPRRDEGPRPGRNNEMADGVWFRINVGRERNADPKWLLPEICRQGEITKKDVGAIRVEETQTLVQIEAGMAAAFAEKVAARTKGGVRIMPADRPPEAAPGRKPFHETKMSPESKGKPSFKKRKEGKKWDGAGKWNKGPGAKLKRGGKPAHKGAKRPGG